MIPKNKERNGYAALQRGIESYFEASKTPAISRNSVSMLEYERHCIIRMDLPNIKKEEIKVEVRNKVMRITAERVDMIKKDENKASQRIGRVFVLPDNAKAIQAETMLRKGVFTVTIPKDHE